MYVCLSDCSLVRAVAVHRVYIGRKFSPLGSNAHCCSNRLGFCLTELDRFFFQIVERIVKSTESVVLKSDAATFS